MAFLLARSPRALASVGTYRLPSVCHATFGTPMYVPQPAGVARLASSASLSATQTSALKNMAIDVFDMKKAKRYMNAETFSSWMDGRSGVTLNKAQRNSIASAVQTFALERGAVNFAHWFSPVRGGNAEKHNAFVDVDHSNGDLVNDFSGSKLFFGETDGSSFPNGGLRATHTAAAYTGWDMTSAPFVRDDTLYVPASFVTHHGEPLDNKTPLLRSQDAVQRQGLRLLRNLGDKKSKRVISNVGWEQEFFVVDREMYDARPDLVACGRTLVGGLPHKGQQADQNYFGRQPLRTRALLRDVQQKLWRLGVSFNVLHAEVAPAQHEISPVFTVSSRAADENAVAMELLQEAAARHGLVVLMHEKPFAGVNGNGKHCNWGLNTDTGANLFVPGIKANEQARFMALCAALSHAVHVHGDLLRIGVASAGNDHRLGAQEAPPAIISLYTGVGLEKHIDSIIAGGPLAGYGKGRGGIMLPVTDAVQAIEAGKEDRNRTAPFPFCGNRFEFRAVGSNAHIAWALSLLNTAVADGMDALSTKLEKGMATRDAVAETFAEHRQVIFNGDGYSSEWVTEAEKRGLFHLKTTPDAVKQLDSPKNVEVLQKHNIFTEQGVRARKEIMLEEYAAVVSMEVTCLLDMMHTSVIPAALQHLKENSGGPKNAVLDKYMAKQTQLVADAVSKTEALQDVYDALDVDAGSTEKAEYTQQKLMPAVEEVRQAADKLERIVEAGLWPFPKFDEILHKHQMDSADHV